MRLVLLAALAGCYRPGTSDSCAISCASDRECPDGLACGASKLCSTTNRCAGDVDGGVVDVPTDPCFGVFWQSCVAPTDTTLVLQGSFDTDTDPRCHHIDQPDGMPACVVAAVDMITVTGFHAEGGQPLVLSANTVVIDGLDVASTKNTQGAGRCTMVVAASENGRSTDDTLATFYGAGGAGGAHQGKGGDGGDVDLIASANDGVGGVSSAALAMPTVLTGGCPGGDGAASDVGSASNGIGGRGGGAVLVVARIRIDVAGTINASGMGGGGGRLQRGGGGGGGAGGLIVLDAPTVALALSSRLLANGGGGGAGQDDIGNMVKDGGDPDPNAMSAAQATGAGAMSPSGSGQGNGGPGSAIGGVAGTGGRSGANFAGGGGGGGGGYILVISPNAIGTALFEAPASTRLQ